MSEEREEKEVIEEENDEKKGEKKLEVITGDGSNLDISPVYEHINAAKPKVKEQNPKNIIVPTDKKLKKSKSKK